MTPYEEQCITRVYNAACGTIDRREITKRELDMTIEILKKCADARDDWSQQQKEACKSLADFAKEQIKRGLNG